MTLILITHIFVAISGLLIGTLGAVWPSSEKLAATYGFLGATLASGTVLVVVSNSPLVSACLSGLLYSVVVLALAFVAQRRLAKAKIGQN